MHGLSLLMRGRTSLRSNLWPLTPLVPGPTSDLPSAGHQFGVVWTSLLGHTYPTTHPPIIEPLPHPLPQHEPATPPLVQPDDDWDNSQIWAEPPLESAPQPPPEPDPNDGIPPS